MRPLQYALVAYVQDPVGQFVEELRRDLYPAHAHLPAHVTVLPPRCLSGTEDQAVEWLRENIAGMDRFTAAVDSVESFFPTTPTVFLHVSRAAYRFREMHDLLNREFLYFDEQWPYMPHMTIVKMPELSQAQHALELSRRRWQEFTGSRTIQVQELTFVREAENSCWTDLASIQLGTALIGAGSRR